MSSAMGTQCREGAVEDQRGNSEKAGCAPQAEGRGKSELSGRGAAEGNQGRGH